MRWRGARLINFIKLISAAAEGRGLVYWIMDDGSLQNKGLHLNTYGFTNQAPPPPGLPLGAMEKG